MGYVMDARSVFVIGGAAVSVAASVVAIDPIFLGGVVVVDDGLNFGDGAASIFVDFFKLSLEGVGPEGRLSLG